MTHWYWLQMTETIAQPRKASSEIGGMPPHSISSRRAISTSTISTTSAASAAMSPAQPISRMARKVLAESPMPASASADDSRGLRSSPRKAGASRGRPASLIRASGRLPRRPARRS